MILLFPLFRTITYNSVLRGRIDLPTRIPYRIFTRFSKQTIFHVEVSPPIVGNDVYSHWATMARLRSAVGLWQIPAGVCVECILESSRLRELNAETIGRQIRSEDLGADCGNRWYWWWSGM
jgi:hypothetical protein